MKKKKQIQRTNNDTTTTKAELNKLKMTICICLDYYILRAPLTLFNVINVQFDTIFWNCMFFTGNASYILSYLLKIFIFYFYNKKFKKYTKLTLRFK
jgi:hypothetical protein